MLRCHYLIINLFDFFKHVTVIKFREYLFSCRFSMKSRGSKDANGDAENIELSVYDYFVKHQGRKLQYSEDLPCINVGKPKRPTYFPIEVKYISLCCDSVQLINLRFNFDNNSTYVSVVLYFDFITTLHKGIDCYSEIVPGRKIKAETIGKDKYFD